MILEANINRLLINLEIYDTSAFNRALKSCDCFFDNCSKIIFVAIKIHLFFGFLLKQFLGSKFTNKILIKVPIFKSIEELLLNIVLISNFDE